MTMAQSKKIQPSLYTLAEQNPEDWVDVIVRVNKADIRFSFNQHLPSNVADNLRNIVFIREISAYIDDFRLPLNIMEYFSNLSMIHLKGSVQDILTIAHDERILNVEHLLD
jgi:hypothetical protein